ncbi:MAG: cupin domain-containing protein [Candidatus Berkelbacteria bacterium]|nr:cupin domain-containing protein [Candidatus Berkelbacteria bacterium]
MAQAIVRREPDHVEPCPCGQSERFFTAKDEACLGLHRTTISDAKPHFHRAMTETYYVLDGSGAIWLDGVRHEVAQGTAILIPPGVVHHGEGVYQVIVAYDHPELHQTDTHHPEG